MAGGSTAEAALALAFVLKQYRPKATTTQLATVSKPRSVPNSMKEKMAVKTTSTALAMAWGRTTRKKKEGRRPVFPEESGARAKQERSQWPQRRCRFSLSYL